MIELLHGNPALANLTWQAVWIGISVISELEFLSFPNLSAQDELLFQQFRNRVEVISLDSSDVNLIGQVIQIRRARGVKLPDAIVAASTILKGATLVSNDVYFSKINGLPVQGF